MSESTIELPVVANADEVSPEAETTVSMTPEERVTQADLLDQIHAECNPIIAARYEAEEA